MMDYLVSLIMPIHELNDCVLCFENLKKQTIGFDNIEILCVLSEEYIAEWGKNNYSKYDNIRTIFVGNDLSEAERLNSGVESTTGKYVMFADCSTYFDCTAIQKMVAKLEEYDCDMVQCEFKKTKLTDEVGIRNGEDSFMIFAGNDSGRRNYILNHYSVNRKARVYKRSVLVDNCIRFVEAGMYSDIHFSGILLFVLQSVYHLAETLMFEWSAGQANREKYAPLVDYNSSEEMLLIKAADAIDADLERLGLMQTVNEKYIKEYQYFVTGKTFFDPSYRINNLYDKTESFLLERLFKRFPDVAMNGYFDGLRLENNVSCVEAMRSVYYSNDYAFMNDPSVIHICMGLHDKYGTYSSNVGTVIHSVVKNTQARVCFHVFIDNTVSEDNKAKICASVGESHSRVIFHLINPDDIDMQDNRWYRQYTIGALFRLLIPEVLTNLHKVIYFDADLLVNRDIRELWNIDISHYSIAAIHDIGFERGITPAVPIRKGEVEMAKYFNSGVIVMNLDKIRARGVLAELCFNYLAENKDTNLPDQDALNYVFRDETLLIDPCWNTFTRYERLANKELREVIYHYMGEPFIFYNNPTKYDKLYIRTREETPWGYSLVEDDLYGGMATGYDKLDYLQKMTKALTTGNKKRIYYGLNTNSMKNIQSMVVPREGDYCVCHDMIDIDGKRYGMPVKEFEDVAKENKGDVIIFVLPEAEGGTVLGKLNEIGLVNGEDYFVIPRLLTVDQGGYVR